MAIPCLTDKEHVDAEARDKPTEDVPETHVLSKSESHVSETLDVAADVLALAAMAHAMIAQFANEPAKHAQIVDRTAVFIEGGEKVEKANEQAAAVAWAVKSMVSLQTVRRVWEAFPR